MAPGETFNQLLTECLEPVLTFERVDLVLLDSAPPVPDPRTDPLGREAIDPSGASQDGEEYEPD